MVTVHRSCAPVQCHDLGTPDDGRAVAAGTADITLMDGRDVEGHRAWFVDAALGRFGAQQREHLAALGAVEQFGIRYQRQRGRVHAFDDVPAPGRRELQQRTRRHQHWLEEVRGLLEERPTGRRQRPNLHSPIGFEKQCGRATGGVVRQRRLHLEHRHARRLGEFIGDRDARDAATDHDDVGEGLGRAHWYAVPMVSACHLSTSADCASLT